ncbi:hypothetical protein BDV96DRAFT_508597, partial [Lophiotrema nucula]
FERILAVSASDSWRRKGLLEAATLTGISVQVPAQPVWKDNELKRFTSQTSRTSGIRLTTGEAGCWLGHLHLIEYVAKANLTSALIVEDDVDWDVALKDQLELICPSVRALQSPDTPSNTTPYGTHWDLLWLGHCGDAIPTTDVQTVQDQSLPGDGIYIESDGRRTPFPKYLRMAHWSVAPICTYAYGITSLGASRILGLINHGVNAQISEQYQSWCQHGNLRCITVNPELFHHHMHIGSPISQIDTVDGWMEISNHSGTVNIGNSARCHAQTKGARCA